MNRPQPRPGVLDIAPYVPGKSTAPGVAKVFKLSSNETPLGPSANAIATRVPNFNQSRVFTDIVPPY